MWGTPSAFGTFASKKGRPTFYSLEVLVLSRACSRAPAFGPSLFEGEGAKSGWSSHVSNSETTPNTQTPTPFQASITLQMNPIPNDRIYTRDDLWLKPEGDDWLVGLTDYAQNELGELVLVELKAHGAHFSLGEALAVVESVKSISEISAPGAGEIVAVNAAVEASPELVNSAPFEAGWLLKIKGAAPLETLDATQYAAWRRL